VGRGPFFSAGFFLVELEIHKESSESEEATLRANYCRADWNIFLIFDEGISDRTLGIYASGYCQVIPRL